MNSEFIFRSNTISSKVGLSLGSLAQHFSINFTYHWGFTWFRPISIDHNLCEYLVCVFNFTERFFLLSLFQAQWKQMRKHHLLWKIHYIPVFQVLSKQEFLWILTLIDVPCYLGCRIVLINQNRQFLEVKNRPNKCSMAAALINSNICACL